MKLVDACVFVLAVGLFVPAGIDVLTRVPPALLRQERMLTELATVTRVEQAIRSTVMRMSATSIGQDLSWVARPAELRGLELVSAPKVVTRRVGRVVVPGVSIAFAYGVAGRADASTYVISEPIGYRGEQ